MSPEEFARLLLSVVLFPACVYVAFGTLAAFPWWAYVVASFVLLVVATRSEVFGEAMLRCGTAAVLLLATASLLQVVPLANRVVLGAILLASLAFSLFTLVTGRGARLNEMLGALVNYWLGFISILIIVIMISYVLHILNIQTYDFEYYAFRVLRFMAAPLYNAGLELWLLAFGS